MRMRGTSPTLKLMPRDQETDVPRDATLLVTAPRPVNHGSASGIRVWLADRALEGVLDISWDGRVLFWRPTKTMEADAQHHVTVSGMCDERGVRFDDLSSTFVTGRFLYADFGRMVE